MFWVKVTLNDCFFSKILLSYSRIFFRIHSILWFGLLSCWNVPVIQRLLIFTLFLISSLYIEILTHTFSRFIFTFTNWCIWNMYRKKVIGGLTLLSI